MLKHYMVLGVSPGTGDKEIRRAYLELVKRFTPERSPELFRQITEAYEALKDETRRIQNSLYGSFDVVYPEEEIAQLARLAVSPEKRIGLRDLVELEKASTAGEVE